MVPLSPSGDLGCVIVVRDAEWSIDRPKTAKVPRFLNVVLALCATVIFPIRYSLCRRDSEWQLFSLIPIWLSAFLAIFLLRRRGRLVSHQRPKRFSRTVRKLIITIAFDLLAFSTLFTLTVLFHRDFLAYRYSHLYPTQSQTKISIACAVIMISDLLAIIAVLTHDISNIVHELRKEFAKGRADEHTTDKKAVSFDRRNDGYAGRIDGHTKATTFETAIMVDEKLPLVGAPS